MVPHDSRAAALALLAGKSPGIAAKEGGFTGQPALERAINDSCGIAPAAMRGLSGGTEYTITYGGPFHLDQMLRYLGRDPDNASERLHGASLTRHFPVDSRHVDGRPVNGRQVRVTLALGSKSCAVTLGRKLAPAHWLEVHGALRRLLGLDQPLDKFYRQVRGHPVFAPLIKPLRGVRIPQVPTLWEALSWAIMGQQINLAFAYKLRNRLIRLGNEKAAEGAPGLVPLPFPGPEAVLKLKPDTLRTHQFSRQKIAYLGIAARACLEGPLRGLSLERNSPEEAEEAMLSVKGIGRWSAAYGLMRHLGHVDALPVGDAGLRAALKEEFGLQTPPDIAEQERLMEPFRPYRGLATYYLWRSKSARKPD